MPGSRIAQAGLLTATLAFPAHTALAIVSPFAAMAGTKPPAETGGHRFA